jgi:hypothetical protein
MNIESFFEKLWSDYIQLAPQAEEIHRLFEKTYHCKIINDHVAFRTFGRSDIDIINLEPILTSLGYRPYDQYQFEAKKLNAVSYHCDDDDAPLIFLSELKWWELAPAQIKVVERIIEQIPPDLTYQPDLFSTGRLWQAPDESDYQTLLKESEYAAWLAVHGLHANHFTVAIHTLPNQPDIEEIVKLLETNGFTLNEAGGTIKGEIKDLLRQASTIAPCIPTKLSEQHCISVPGCYYEFAQRYLDENGSLFKGFVPSSANKIFESTHIQAKPQ